MFEKFVRQEDVNERKRLHCADCKRLTIHTAEARCTGSWSEPYGPNGGSSYTIYRCGACDTVCFEMTSWDSEHMDHEHDGEIYAIETAIQYPPPVSAHFTFNTEYTPGRLDGILDEMLSCLAGNKLTLATMGLRLAVEFIVKDVKCVGRSLDKKIDDLFTKSLIDDEQRTLLHRIRKRGNAGAHEAVGMSAEELVAGMGIVEGLLEKLYNGPARHKATMEMAKQLLADDEEDEESQEERPPIRLPPPNSSQVITS